MSEGNEPMGTTPPTVTLDSGGEIDRAGRGTAARVLAGIIGVVLLLGGVAFAAAQFGDDRTPEEAVDELLQALSDEDVLGALAALDPGERDALAPAMQDVVGELRRLEVLDDSVDLGSVSGLDIEFEGVTYRTEPVLDDLVRVHVVSGTVTTGYDTSQLPVGDFLSDTFDRFDVDYGSESDSTTEPIEDDQETFLAVRNGDDGWRVSVGYTIAEQARIESGAPVPTPDSGLEPVGAESPELAVEGLIRAGADLDLAGVVARLSPSEIGALHTYWALATQDTDLNPPEDLGLSIDVQRLDLRSETDGDRARVFLDGFAMRIVLDGSEVALDFSDGCLTYSGDLEELGFEGFNDGEPLCQDDVDQSIQESLETSGFDDLGFEIPEFPPFRTPEYAVITQRVDGDWYVAPVASGADMLVESLRAIDRAHLDAMVDLAEQFVLAFTGSFESSFSEEGVAIGPDGEPFGDLFGDGTTSESRPRPGTSSDPEAELALAAIEELAASIAPSDDPEAAACVVDALLAMLDTDQLYELADAQTTGSEPSQATQDAFFEAVGFCTPA